MAFMIKYASSLNKKILPAHNLIARYYSSCESLFYHSKSIDNSRQLKQTLNTRISDMAQGVTSSWTPESVVPSHIKKLLTKSNKTKPTDYILAFFEIVRLLKVQKRTGWLDRNIDPKHVESIGDHMYRMSIISMAIPNDKINKDKCVKIALVHDIAESLVGDITPIDPMTKEEKHHRELITVEYLSDLIAPYNESFAKELVELWTDYEEIRNLEARYVKDVDKYEMIQQAYEYEVLHEGAKNLEEFFSARTSIKTPEISELADALLEKRKEFWEGIEQ